jgi:hypothetical protein
MSLILASDALKKRINFLILNTITFEVFVYRKKLIKITTIKKT